MTTDTHHTTIHPQHPTTPRRLTRSSSDKKLGGVAGGLGEYFSVDPTVIRASFALSILFGGAGAVAYVLLWAFVPTDADDRAPLAAQPMAA